jgi:uncharacterized membrane protein
MLIAGMVLFFGTHLVRVVAPGFRERMVGRFGAWGWKGLYSVPALAGFLLMAWGYGSVRWSSPPLWGPATGGARMAVGLVMLPVLVLFVSAYLPGWLRATLRHPMMIATVAWATLHLSVNGRAADLLLFGGFLVWSLVVLIASFRRPRLAPARRPSLLWDAVALAAGLGAWWWLAFGGGHVRLFGVPVM